MLALGLTAGAQGVASAVDIVDTVPAREFPIGGKFIPPHTNGDRDFAGHGPEVFVDVFIDGVFPGSRTLTLQICMDAKETKSDNTRANGCTLRFQIYQTSVGHCIQSISHSTVDRIHYIDTNHSDDVFGRQKLLSIVNRWTVTGDLTGNEAGSRTGVLIKTFDFRVTSVPC